MCKLRINIMCKLTNAARDVWFQIALHNSLWNYRFIFYLHWLRFKNNCPQTKLRINFYIAANEANKQSKRRPKNWQCKKHWPIRIVLLFWGINFICKSHSRTKQKKMYKIDCHNTDKCIFNNIRWHKSFVLFIVRMDWPCGKGKAIKKSSAKNVLPFFVLKWNGQVPAF